MSGAEFNTANYRPLKDDIKRVPGVNETPVNFEMPSTESVTANYNADAAASWAARYEERRSAPVTVTVPVR